MVDYIGIKKQMNQALKHYNKSDEKNFKEIQQTIVVVKDHLDLLAKLCHQFDTTPYFKGSPLEQLDCLIMLLADQGYAPVERDEVYKEIFEPAGNFKK